MAPATSERETTTVTVHRSTHRRLKEVRPFESMSFDDLISEMADVYEQER
jgi:hypothetical protein